MGAVVARAADTCVGANLARPSSLWLVVVACLATAATGCGGGKQNGSSSSSTKTTTAASGPSTSSQTKAGAPPSGSTTPSSATDRSSVPAPPTPAAQANAICAHRNHELITITRPGSNLKEIVDSASLRAAVQRRSLGEMERISPPPGPAADWKTVLVSSEHALQATEQLVHSSRSSDLATLRKQIALISKPQLRLLLTATKAGLKACAVVAGPTLKVPVQAR